MGRGIASFQQRFRKSVCALLATTFTAYSLGQPAPIYVTLHKAEKKSISDITEALGTLKAKESVDITSSVTETIADIYFDDGQIVKKGTLLANLDQQEELAQFDQEKASLVELQRDVKRLEKLVKQRSASQTELDKARTEVIKAQFRIVEIEARIADRQIKAPFTGVLGLRNISDGALVSAGVIITTLDNIDILHLDFSIPAVLLTKIEPGQRVTATSTSYERIFSGVITAMDSRVNVVDRSIIFRAEFKNYNSLLKPGMLMRVNVESASREAILVPEETLFSKERNHFVWLINNKKNTVSLRQVELGNRVPGEVEIVSGLAVGEQIIQGGFVHMRPGAVVTSLKPKIGVR
tara:strand:- start:331 stop:1383 length:1053 start_codon:yes stop_codon:yes gene_type:complete